MLSKAKLVGVLPVHFCIKVGSVHGIIRTTKHISTSFSKTINTHSAVSTVKSDHAYITKKTVNNGLSSTKLVTLMGSVSHVRNFSNCNGLNSMLTGTLRRSENGNKRCFSTSCGLRSAVEVEVVPSVSLNDARTSIAVSGLEPYKPVTLKLSARCHKGKEFCSTAHYISNVRGRVEVDTSFSQGGSYRGVFPAGLLTSLKPVGERNKYSRFTVPDTAKSRQFTVAVFDGFLEHHECVTPLASVGMERRFRGPGVKRVEVEAGRVRGALYIPGTPGPHPAVVDMYGSASTITEQRAALLASHGILALALPYFSYRDLTKDLQSVELEYFEEAVEYLLSQPSAIPDRCGAVGVCHGGINAVVMGTFIDKVKAVLSINSASTFQVASISYKGKPLVGGICFGSNDIVFDKDDRATVNYESCTEWLHPDYEHTIPIEKATRDTYFHLNSSDFCTFRGPLSAEALKVRMDRSGHTNYRISVYKGAGHMLEPPYMNHMEHGYQGYLPIEGLIQRGPKTGVFQYWGGTAEGTCVMQENVWRDIKDMIFEHVQNRSLWYQQYIQQQ